MFSSLEKGINHASGGVSGAVLLRGTQVQLRLSSIGTKEPAVRVPLLHLAGTGCEAVWAIRKLGSKCVIKVLFARRCGRCVLRVAPSLSSVFCAQLLLLDCVTA